MSDRISIIFEEGENQLLPIRFSHTSTWKNSLEAEVISDMDILVREYDIDGGVTHKTKYSHQISTNETVNGLNDLSDLTSVVVDKMVLSGTYWDPKDVIIVNGVEVSKFSELAELADRLITGMNQVNTKWFEDNPIHIRYDLGDGKHIEVNNRFDLNFLVNYRPSSGSLLKDLEYGIYSRKYEETLSTYRLLQRENSLRSELAGLGVMLNAERPDISLNGNLYIKYEDKAKKFEEKNNGEVRQDINF